MVTCVLFAQRASNAESVPKLWHHHGVSYHFHNLMNVATDHQNFSPFDPFLSWLYIFQLFINWNFRPHPFANYCLHFKHYNDFIMSAMASQITSLTIIYSTIYSRRRSKKTSKLRVTGLCERNSPVTGEFPSQRASKWEMFPFDDVIMNALDPKLFMMEVNYWPLSISLFSIYGFISKLNGYINILII